MKPKDGFIHTMNSSDMRDKCVMINAAQADHEEDQPCSGSSSNSVTSAAIGDRSDRVSVMCPNSA